jgi:hypothetical protein
MMNQQNTAPTVSLSPAFLQEMQAFAATEAKYRAGELKPYPFSLERDRHIAAALHELAASHGVRLKPLSPRTVDGEVLVAAVCERVGVSDASCGQFGTFAALLNPLRPRCVPDRPAVMHAGSGWCYIPHSALERLVKQQAAAAQSALSS